MNELQSLYDQLKTILNKIKSSTNDNDNNKQIINDSQISFNIFYQNLPNEIQTFIHEFYYPSSFTFDYLMIVFKGIYIIAKNFVEIHKEVVEVLKHDQFTISFDELIEKLIKINPLDLEIDLKLMKKQKLFSNPFDNEINELNCFNKNNQNDNINNNEEKHIDQKENENEKEEIYNYCNQKKKELLQTFITMGITVYSSIEFYQIPMNIFSIDFEHSFEMTIIQQLLTSFVDSLNEKIVKQFIKNIKSRNNNFEEIIIKIIRNMDSILPNDHILSLFSNYIHFISKTCRFDLYIFNFHLQSLFFNKLTKILLQCNESIISSSTRSLTSIVALLQNLCFYGDGVESLQSIRFDNYTQFSTDQTGNKIRNTEIPALMVKLLECKMLTLPVLQSLKVILFSNALNFTLLPGYIESICLMIVNFNEEEIDYVFGMLEYLFIVLQIDPSSYLKIVLAVINYDILSKQSFLTPFVGFMTRLIGSNVMYYQKHFQPFLKTFMNCLNQSFENFEKETEITRTLVKMMKGLIMDNKENVENILANEGLIDRMVTSYLTYPHHRNSIVTLLIPILVQVNDTQGTGILTPILHDIIHDVEPLSRLKTISVILDKSILGKELFGLCDNFGLFKQFIETWEKEDIENDIDEENEEYKQLKYKRLQILNSCINCFISALKGRPENKEYLLSLLPLQFLEEFVENNPWKEQYSREIIIILISLLIEEPIRVSELLLVSNSKNIFITNYYMFPALFKMIDLLEEKEQNYLIKNIISMIDNPYSAYGLYQMNTLEMILNKFSCNINDDLYLKLLQKIGGYSISYNSCKLMLQEMNKEPFNSKLLSALSYISSGSTIGGYTFDTLEKISFIKSHVWIDKLPFTICGWFKFDMGYYNILEITSTQFANVVRLSLQNKYFTMLVNDKPFVSAKVSFSSWFHIAITFSDKVSLFLNGELQDEKVFPFLFNQGSYGICIGNYELSHSTEGKFSIAELFLINGKRNISELKAMVNLGPKYSGKYASSDYTKLATLSKANEQTSIYIERNDIIYSMTDLMNDNLFIGKTIKGRVCPSCPSPFVKCIVRCGGIALILSLIEKTSTSSELCDGLQMLLFCLRNSSELYQEAIATHSFDILILILHTKRHLISLGVIQTLLTLSGIGTSFEKFNVTHPEILTTLVLDFRLLKSCQNGIEYVLKTIKSVYDFSATEASKTMESVRLIKKLMLLFIDDTAEVTALPYILQILTSILTVNCEKEEVETIISFASYFLDAFERADTTYHKEWCASRLIQLIEILEKIIKIKGTLPGLTPSFIYQFIDLKNPPTTIIYPLLRLAAILSDSSQQFYEEFSLHYDHLFNIISILSETNKCFCPLYALLFHIYPDETIIENYVTLKQQPNPFYLKVLFEIIRTTLISQAHPLRNSNSCLIIETLSKILRNFYVLRSAIVDNDEIIHSLLNIIISNERTLLTREPFSREQQNICKEIIHLIGYLSAALIRDRGNYKKIFIGAIIIEPKGEFLECVINDTIDQLTNLTQSVNKVKLSEYLIDFAHFLLDMLFIQQLNVNFNLIITSIGKLMKFYSKNKDIQSNDITKSWLDMIGRMNLILFDNEDDESMHFAIKQFYDQDFFFEKQHSEFYISSLLCIILKKIYEDVEIIQDHRDPILYNLLKKIIMSYQDTVMKVVQTRDLKKKFKNLLQMNVDDIVDFFNDNLSIIDKLTNQYQINLKLFKDTQNERKMKIIQYIIDENDSFEKDKKKLYETEREKLKCIGIDWYSVERDEMEHFSEEAKIFLKETWKRMKVKLIMPTGIWEKPIQVYKIDDIEGPLGMRRRIVIDYEFEDKFDVNNGEKGLILKLNKIKTDDSSESSSKKTDDTLLDLNEHDEIEKVSFECKHLNGLDETESMLILDKTGLKLIHQINDKVAYSKGKYNMIALEWCEIQTIVKRRYLFENNSLEFFSTFGKSMFLVFERKYDKVIRRISKWYTNGVENLNANGGLKAIPFLGKLGKVFMQSDDVIELWKKGEMSNFGYLTYLNMQAGRSKNDLSQYPIFPWVLNNYKSNTIDLDNETNYRNFAYPVVAQTERRRERLKMKFEEIGSHYGNHYSSLATTLIYLFRCEPYTKMHIQLFDGHFDTDRLLISIASLYENLSATPIELIPEFFYLSQFLVNFNNIDFGKRRDGVVVNNISLPPWCHDNPRIFVDINMKALESPYVSEHLHEWIDLIFGYKQRGKAAEEACNIFPASTYENNDIGKMNEKEKETLKIKIQNFGQTPLQLFKTPHPKREVKQTNYSLGIFESNYCNSLSVLNKSGFPIGQIRINEKNEIKISRKGEVYLSNGIIKSIGGDMLKMERNNKIHCVEECQSGKILITNDKIIVIGGSDGTLEIIDIIDDSPKKRGRLCGHNAPINCCIIGTKNNIIITSDEEGYCIIWDIRSLMCLHVFQIDEKIVDIAINDETGDFVILSNKKFYYYDINGDLIGESDYLENQCFTAICISQAPVWCFERFIVTGDIYGNIMYWKVNENYSFTSINMLTTYPLTIEQLRINEGNTSLVMGYSNGVVICLQ